MRCRHSEALLYLFDLRQVVADAQLRFLSVDARFLGNTHDAYVLAVSAVPEQLEAAPPNGWLLGDSGYPCG